MVKRASIQPCLLRLVRAAPGRHSWGRTLRPDAKPPTAQGPCRKPSAGEHLE
eukprot:CAMPEP_0195042532 /NCGR_PEP_ID=MMETSP0347-20130606/2766_1 /TAXON_ID=2932 /ORGANISM="Alexandrium fundyense, Strain CCMP1719" /LENGTH=51 /DNA_ID=CAMNT_0040069785 /DNA_START=39 /DNA_END=191 /DNA_ORIENTATION=+